jgi:hypothetical protein
MPVIRPSFTTSTIFSMIASLRTWKGISVKTIEERFLFSMDVACRARGTMPRPVA